MFNLIITIISIALVAALSLASIFYGGQAFQMGTLLKEATAILKHAESLQGAIAYKNAHNLKDVNQISDLEKIELESGNYLLSTTLFKELSWSEPNEKGFSEMRIAINDDACNMINREASIEVKPSEIPSKGIYGCYQTEEQENRIYYRLGSL